MDDLTYVMCKYHSIFAAYVEFRGDLERKLYSSLILLLLDRKGSTNKNFTLAAAKAGP